jgi:hypothetical protein
MMTTRALLYFNSVEEKWPITPAEVLASSNKLILHYPSETLDRLNGSPAGTARAGYMRTFDLSYNDVDSLMDSVHKAYSVFSQDEIDIVYMVHPRSTFLLLLKWHFMRVGPSAKEQYQRAVFHIRAHDLCEEFYRPAVLPYETRCAFGPKSVRDWLGLDDSYDDFRVLTLLMDSTS